MKVLLDISFVISSKSITLLGAYYIIAFFSSVKKSTKCLLKRFCSSIYFAGFFIYCTKNKAELSIEKFFIG